MQYYSPEMIKMINEDRYRRLGRDTHAHAPHDGERPTRRSPRRRLRRSR